MNVNFVYRNVDKSKALEYAFNERLAKVERMNLGLKDVKVELSKEGRVFRVVLLGYLRYGEIVTSETSDDTKIAMNLVIDKFEGALRKEKTRYDKKRREKSLAKENARQKAQDELEDNFEEYEDEEYVD